MESPKHFNRTEFTCKCGCGFNTVDFELMIILEDVREHFGLPISVHSGCRCETYNKKVGGKPKSQHLLGRASDISIKGITPQQIYDYLITKYPNKYGIGKYPTFVHVDTRSVGIWRQD